MVIVPTVNIAEEFYTKLTDMNVKPIRSCVNDIAFKEFNNDVNIIIITYNSASKCLGVLIEEYYIKEQRLDNFLGPNNNWDSDMYVYARNGKHMKKRNYSIPNNRYERY